MLKISESYIIEVDVPYETETSDYSTMVFSKRDGNKLEILGVAYGKQARLMYATLQLMMEKTKRKELKK